MNTIHQLESPEPLRDDFIEQGLAIAALLPDKERKEFAAALAKRWVTIDALRRSPVLLVDHDMRFQ